MTILNSLFGLISEVIVLAVILGVFNLAKFPWGTAIALYTFWIAYRLSDAAERFG